MIVTILLVVSPSASALTWDGFFNLWRYESQAMQQIETEASAIEVYTELAVPNYGLSNVTLGLHPISTWSGATPGENAMLTSARMEFSLPYAGSFNVSSEYLLTGILPEPEFSEGGFFQDVRVRFEYQQPLNFRLAYRNTSRQKRLISESQNLMIQHEISTIQADFEAVRIYAEWQKLYWSRRLLTQKYLILQHIEAAEMDQGLRGNPQLNLIEIQQDITRCELQLADAERGLAGVFFNLREQGIFSNLSLEDFLQLETEAEQVYITQESKLPTLKTLWNRQIELQELQVKILQDEISELHRPRSPVLNLSLDYHLSSRDYFSGGYSFLDSWSNLWPKDWVDPLSLNLGVIWRPYNRDDGISVRIQDVELDKNMGQLQAFREWYPFQEHTRNLETQYTLQRITQLERLLNQHAAKLEAVSIMAERGEYLGTYLLREQALHLDIELELRLARIECWSLMIQGNIDSTKS